MFFPKFVYMTKNTPFFSNFARFCTPKRCTHVQCLVLKNNPNYVNFWTSLIPPLTFKWPPQVKDFKMCSVLQHGWSPERESMIPYQMILLNCIGCQLSKGLISRSWFLCIRLSTISHLITSPACSNYGLIPGTSSPHLFAPQLVQPWTHHITFADRAFSCYAPRKWNQLPPQIRNAYSITIFKRLLKSHLFELAYGQ